MAVLRGLGVAAVGGILLWTAPASAQVAPTALGTITGRVVDSASQAPLPSVTVRIEGTTLGALTRADGEFVLAGVPAGTQRLRAARIGFKPQIQPVTVTAGGTANIVFVLGATAASLEDVVVVGYGTQRREAVTGAVSTVKADQANVGVVPNVNNLVQGRAAGVTVTVNSGEPGAGAQIRVRGGTSISASNEPLYVVDGVPIANAQTEGGAVTASGASTGTAPALPRSPLNLINPSDIATVTILKDAAATAIYGSRGANGVVLIETKKGVAGTSAVDYDGYAATSSAANSLDVLSASQYRSFVQQQVAAGVLDTSRLSSLGTANTNWEDAITRNALTQNHNLSFSGGSVATQYRASLNYMDQQGVVISNGFTRYQGRLNGATRAFGDKVNLGLNLTASQVRNRYLPYENTGGFDGGVFLNEVTFNPTRPITVVDSATGLTRFFEIPGQTTIRNPVGLAEQINDHANTTRVLGNVTGSYQIFSPLTASVNVGVDRSSGLRQIYFPNSNPAGAATNGRAKQTERNVSTATVQTLLTYSQAFGSQTADVTGGYEYSDTQINEFGAEAQNFVTDAFTFNNLGAGAGSIKPYSLNEPRRLASLFARANYGLNNKYFLTGVIRRDGSSVFGENNKYAVFPAVSAAWRVIGESFAEGLPFSDLKLRAGYGLQGNQAISPFQSLILLGTDNGAQYQFGNTIYTGVTPSQNANPNLKWETTAQTNVAADYGFLNNRLTGTVEYYVKNTRDLLLSVDVPQPAPVSTQIQNIGRVRNKGVEASLDATFLNETDRSFSAGLVFSADRNRVVDLGGRQFITTASVSGQGQSGQNSQRIIPGQPLGTFYGPQFAGVNAQGQQLFNKYTVTRDSVGRVISRSLNGTTTTPGGDDNVILGNANPKYELGLRSNGNWHKFDASFLVRASGGAKVFNNTALVYATKGNVLQDKNFLQSALNDGIGIKEPAIYSSRYIEDASFVRLQNVTVGYSLDVPGGATGRPNTARIYLSGDNLLLSTPYSGYDPEVYVNAGLASRGIDYLTYPRARTFTAGIRLGF